MLRSSVAEIKEDISVEFDFNPLLDRLHSQFHMSSYSPHRIAFNLQMIKNDLDMAQQDRLSPSLVPPDQLSKLLQIDKT